MEDTPIDGIDNLVAHYLVYEDMIYKVPMFKNPSFSYEGKGYLN